MNDTLKAVGSIGAELGAVKAENERLRLALQAIDRRNDSPARFDAEFDRIIRAAISQQAEPVDPAPAQDERERKEFERAYAEYADMDASEVASKWDGDLYSEQEVRDAWWGWTTRPAQTEQPAMSAEAASTLLERIDAAIKAFTSGRASMHVPPDPTDVDLVLGECWKVIKEMAAPIAQTARKVLLLASYCGEDNNECSDDSPCPECLQMCNVANTTGRFEVLGGLGYLVARHPDKQTAPQPEQGGLDAAAEAILNAPDHIIQDLSTWSEADGEPINIFAWEWMRRAALAAKEA